MNHLLPTSALIFLLSSLSTLSAQNCNQDQFRLEGKVLDKTAVSIVHANVTVDRHQSSQTNEQGYFQSACVSAGEHSVDIAAPGFSVASLHVKAAADARPLLVHLAIETVTTEVDATDGQGVDNPDVAGSRTLGATDLRDMADDPDELTRQLQVLAATAGGTPGQALVTVDGFQNSQTLPPKSAISFIRINPDLFSSEYDKPPYQGARIEVYTKPGQGQLHGALFTTQSEPFANARDPFATSRAALGRQRYGFELSGPLRANRTDFSVALEHRQLDQFSVVNAVTLDTQGNPSHTVANVPTPQSLWQGSTRLGWRATAKDNVTFSYTATVNTLENVGTGGVVLREAGHTSALAEHTLHVSDLHTLTANLIHESRLGYTWRYAANTPNSAAPSVEVAGAFTSGGSPLQFTRTHERDLEVDDDLLYSHGKHSMKVGIQLLNVALRDNLVSNFAGTYLFAGGTAPVLGGSGTTTITGIEQYRRALLSLNGGTPTIFSKTAGNPSVALNQLSVALYAQDQWKLSHHVQLALGLRWSMQSAPRTLGNFAPRVGLTWSPDRSQKLVFHLRSGIFMSPISTQTTLEERRLNGALQRDLTFYNPTYGQAGAEGKSIMTLRAPSPHLSQVPSLQSHIGVEYDFPRHWHAQANLYLVRAWDVLRSRNVNAPIDGSPFGTRPGAVNENIDQFQQTGTQHGNVTFLGLDQHSLRRLQLFVGYVRLDLRGNADDDSFFTQNSSSDRGETARPSWEATHEVIAFGTLKLPQALSLTTQFNASSGLPYNVITGFDNNGDGIFNDRPFLASGTGGRSISYPTAFGNLSPTGSGSTIGRNAGTLPWNLHLDMNLSRVFMLTHPATGEGKKLSVNLRSTNALNHTNINAVGNVLGSPLFGQAFAASPGRRVEFGLRYSF